MNEAAEIKHLRKLVWNVRWARARLRVTDPVRRAHVLRLEKFMKKVEARKIVPLPVTQTGTEAAQPYVSKYYRRMARLATAAACLLVLVGCKTSTVTPRESGADAPTLAVRPLPPLPQFNTRAATLTAEVAAPRREKWLVWDADSEAKSFRVYTGPARGVTTNSFVVNTNAVLFKSGVHYRVAPLDYAGREFAGSLWPSNRIAEYRLRDNRGGNALLLRFTNSPPGVYRFWTVTNNPSAFIADVTKGWQ